MTESSRTASWRRTCRRRLGRCEGQDTVLCVHDTTVFRFKTPREGLGEYAGRTLFGHVSMAVGSDGVPLGVVGLHPWARGKDTVTQRKHRGELTYHRSVGLPNESKTDGSRWSTKSKRLSAELGPFTSWTAKPMTTTCCAGSSNKEAASSFERRAIVACRPKTTSLVKNEGFVSSCPVVCTRSVPSFPNARDTISSRHEAEAPSSIATSHAVDWRRHRRDSRSIVLRQERPPILAAPCRVGA